MNGFFQLVASGNQTAIRLVPPSDGGQKLDLTELMDYLQLKKVEPADLKHLYQIVANLDKEVVVPLVAKPCLPEQEMVSIRVSDDHMEVVARFYPPSSNGSLYSGRAEIINDLKFRKVLYGYDEAAIDAFLSKRSYCTDIVIARGTAPVHGTDASIAYFFNTDLNARPTRNEDGSVDFFHLNTINHCKAGDLLARLTREVPGVQGTTVYGEKVNPRTIKRMILKYGRNIELSGDGCEIRSQVNGHVSLVGDKVFVSDVYEVENVGTATGDVESEGSVLVNGNVQAGFSIKAKGNVEVRGVVEGARIECDGDIIIARGMNGMGKGVLKAGGRIILKYAENATISSGSYVESESIMHSTVNARTYITVEGRKGFIAGGVVRAAERISCKTLGSPMGADTVVEVGVDPDSKRHYQETQKELLDAQKNIKNIQPILLNLGMKIKHGEKLKPEQIKYLQSLAAANQQMKSVIEKDQVELAKLEGIMHNEGTACVRVSDEAYAGTKISIGDASLVLKNSVKFCRFVKDRGDIRIAAY